MKIYAYIHTQNDGALSIQVPMRFIYVISSKGQKRKACGLLLGILNKGKLKTFPFSLWHSSLDTTVSAPDLISPTQLAAIAERHQEYQVDISYLACLWALSFPPLTLL